MPTRDTRRTVALSPDATRNLDKLRAIIAAKVPGVRFTNADVMAHAISVALETHNPEG